MLRYLLPVASLTNGAYSSVQYCTRRAAKVRYLAPHPTATVRVGERYSVPIAPLKNVPACDFSPPRPWPHAFTWAVWSRPFATRRRHSVSLVLSCLPGLSLSPCFNMRLPAKGVPALPWPRYPPHLTSPHITSPRLRRQVVHWAKCLQRV